MNGTLNKNQIVIIFAFIYHSAKSVTPDESLPTKQTAVFLTSNYDINATVLLWFLPSSTLGRKLTSQLLLAL